MIKLTETKPESLEPELTDVQKVLLGISKLKSAGDNSSDILEENTLDWTEITDIYTCQGILYSRLP